LVLTVGFMISGCQKAEEPVPRHPLASPVGQPKAGTVGDSGNSTPPPAPSLPPGASAPEGPQEVVGPKDLVRLKPTGKSRRAPGTVQETVPPEAPPAPSPKEPEKEKKPVKSKENVPPAPEKKKDSVEPPKPPHPMPGA
jgi:hypothetical protein